MRVRAVGEGLNRFFLGALVDAGAAQIGGVASSVYAPKAGIPLVRGMGLEFAVSRQLSSLSHSEDRRPDQFRRRPVFTEHE